MLVFSEHCFWSSKIKIHFQSTAKNKSLQINRVATWEPTNGVLANDSLFPHISHGFRGKTLPIATYHVSSTHRIIWMKTANHLFLESTVADHSVWREWWSHINERRCYADSRWASGKIEFHVRLSRFYLHFKLRSKENSRELVEIYPCRGVKGFQFVFQIFADRSHEK